MPEAGTETSFPDALEYMRTARRVLHFEVPDEPDASGRVTRSFARQLLARVESRIDRENPPVYMRQERAYGFLIDQLAESALTAYLEFGVIALANGQLQGHELSEFAAVTRHLRRGVRIANTPAQISDDSLYSKVKAANAMAEAVAALEGNLPASQKRFRDSVQQNHFVNDCFRSAAGSVSLQNRYLAGVDSRAILDAVARRADASHPHIAGVRVGKPYVDRIWIKPPQNVSDIVAGVDYPAGGGRLSSWTIFRKPAVKYPLVTALLTGALFGGSTAARWTLNGFGARDSATVSAKRNGDGEEAVYSVHGWDPRVNPFASLAYTRGTVFADTRVEAQLHVETGTDMSRTGEPAIGVGVSVVTDRDGIKTPSYTHAEPVIESVRIVDDNGTPVERLPYADVRDSAPFDHSKDTESVSAVVPCAPHSGARQRLHTLVQLDRGDRQPGPPQELAVIDVTGCDVDAVVVDPSVLQSAGGRGEAALKLLPPFSLIP